MSKFRRFITIRINIIQSLFETSVEELASCRLLIMGAGSIPIRNCLRVHEIMAYEILDCAVVKTVGIEIDHTISYKQTQ